MLLLFKEKVELILKRLQSYIGAISGDLKTLENIQFNFNNNINSTSVQEIPQIVSNEVIEIQRSNMSKANKDILTNFLHRFVESLCLHISTNHYILLQVYIKLFAFWICAGQAELALDEIRSEYENFQKWIHISGSSISPIKRAKRRANSYPFYFDVDDKTDPNLVLCAIQIQACILEGMLKANQWNELKCISEYNTDSSGTPYQLCLKLINSDNMQQQGKDLMDKFHSIYTSIVNSRIRMVGIDSDCMNYSNLALSFYMQSNYHTPEGSYVEAVKVIGRNLFIKKERRHLSVISEFYNYNKMALVNKLYRVSAVNNSMVVYWTGYLVHCFEANSGDLNAQFNCINKNYLVKIKKEVQRTFYCRYMHWYLSTIYYGLRIISIRELIHPKNLVEYSEFSNEFQKGLVEQNIQAEDVVNFCNNFRVLIDVVFKYNAINDIKGVSTEAIKFWVGTVLQFLNIILAKVIKMGYDPSLEQTMVLTFGTLCEMFKKRNFAFSELEAVYHIFSTYNHVFHIYNDQSSQFHLPRLTYSLGGEYFAKGKDHYTSAAKYFEISVSAKDALKSLGIDKLQKIFSLLAKCYDNSKEYDELRGVFARHFKSVPSIVVKPAFFITQNNDNPLKYKYFKRYIEVNSLTKSKYNIDVVYESFCLAHTDAFINNEEMCYFIENELHLISSQYSEPICKVRNNLLTILLKAYNGNHPVLMLRSFLNLLCLEYGKFMFAKINYVCSLIEAKPDDSRFGLLAKKFEAFLNIKDYKKDKDIKDWVIELKGKFHLLCFNYAYKRGFINLNVLDEGIIEIESFYRKFNLDCNIKDHKTCDCKLYENHIDSTFMALKDTLKVLSLLEAKDQILKIGALCKKLIPRLTGLNKYDQMIDLLYELSKTQVISNSGVINVDYVRSCGDAAKLCPDRVFALIQYKISCTNFCKHDKMEGKYSKSVKSLLKFDSIYNEIKQDSLKCQSLIMVNLKIQGEYLDQKKYVLVNATGEQLNDLILKSISYGLQKPPYNFVNTSGIKPKSLVQLLSIFSNSHIVEASLNNWYSLGIANLELNLLILSEQYLKQGLELSQELNLSRWTRDFKLILVQVCTRLNRFSESENLLNEINLIEECDYSKRDIIKASYYASKIHLQYLTGKGLEINDAKNYFNSIINDISDNLTKRNVLMAYVYTAVHHINNNMEEAQFLSKVANKGSDRFPTIKLGLFHYNVKSFLSRYVSTHEVFNLFTQAWSLPLLVQIEPQPSKNYLSLNETDKNIIGELLLDYMNYFKHNANDINGGNVSFGFRDLALAHTIQAIGDNRTLDPSKACYWISYLLEMTNCANLKTTIIQNLKGYLTANDTDSLKWPKFYEDSRNMEYKRDDKIVSEKLKGYENEFNFKPEEYFNSVISSLPYNWRICSVHYLPETNELCIKRYESNLKHPLLVRFPIKCGRKLHVGNNKCENNLNFNSFYVDQPHDKFKELMKEFHLIIQESTKIIKDSSNIRSKVNNAEWWFKRENLDVKLERFLRNFETDVLKGFIGTFLPFETNDKLSCFYNDIQGLWDAFLNERFPGVRITLDECSMKTVLALKKNITEPLLHSLVNTWLSGMLVDQSQICFDINENCFKEES
ncbi:hypothetical protein K502DRAFT_81205 [Neoconidiobolus thromboides FSU 785]|nr:hypothetical protein K502DRAFT_81205 [Neoconidiobolus thromboides FSU 785]